MKLFLASSLDKSIKSLVEKMGDLSGKKVLFIENASDNEKGDLWWIRDDLEAFEKEGSEIVKVDLREVKKEDFAKLLDSSDIIHFCGGIVLYLISLLRKQDLEDILIQSIKEGSVVYSGTSAGSMIVAKDLSLIKHDPDEQEYVKDLEEFYGLGLVDFLILPHANSNDFVESNVSMVKKMPEYNQSVIILYDNQAIWLEDEKIELISNNEKNIS